MSACNQAVRNTYSLQKLSMFLTVAIIFGGYLGGNIRIVDIYAIRISMIIVASLLQSFVSHGHMSTKMHIKLMHVFSLISVLNL